MSESSWNEPGWIGTLASATTEPTMIDGLRMFVAMGLALATAFAFQRGLLRRGFPAGFVVPWRALGASVLLTLFLFVGVFVPAVLFDQPPEIDTAALGRIDLFASQLVMLAVLAGWALFAFGEPLPSAADDEVEDAGVDWDRYAEPNRTANGSAGVDGVQASVAEVTAHRDWVAFFGLRTARPLEEFKVGLLAGAGAWAAVIATSMVAGLLISAIGGGDALDVPASPLIVYLAGLPVVWRLALSVAAGVVEEIFFRGFLQPRLGIGLSTVCFVLGHAAYGQPMMFVGLTVLSLIYAMLVRRRGNIWAAIVAHTLFDAVQLLVVVPAALEAVATGPG